MVQATQPQVYARRCALLCVAVTCCLLPACRSIGPRRVLADRVSYADAISRTWKDEMLLNLVKLRYADAPLFLDISSVIAQYSLEAQVNAGGQWPDISGHDSLALSGSGRWSDRPTITYVPLSGQRFTRSLLTPIPPASVVSLVQGGWAVDTVFRICVRGINGVRAEARMRLTAQQEDPRFQPLLDALRRLQIRGLIGLRVEKHETGEVALLSLPSDGDPDSQKDVEFVARTLGLDAGVHDFTLGFGIRNRSGREIAMLTRSMTEVLTELALDVQVPADHIADGRTGDAVGGVGIARGSFKVQSGRERPPDAFAAIRYSDYWFWIDARDFRSKRSLSFLMLLLSLAETGGGAVAPGLTVTTGH